MTSDPKPPPKPPPIDVPAGSAGSSDLSPSTTAPANVPFTKSAAAWWALITGVLILIVLLIFIAQNLESTTIHFLGWSWETPRGIAFLVAAICGSLITVLTGAARMFQLRRAARKGLRANRR
jgi:uncharacterized integral membrane protein